MTKRHKESTFWEFQVNNIELGMCFSIYPDFMKKLLNNEEHVVTFELTNHGPICLTVVDNTGASLIFRDDENKFWFIPNVDVDKRYYEIVPMPYRQKDYLVFPESADPNASEVSQGKESK